MSFLNRKLFTRKVCIAVCILTFIVTMQGCGGAGEPNTSDPTDNGNVTPPTPTKPKPIDESLSDMGASYQMQCDACHGPKGMRTLINATDAIIGKNGQLSCDSWDCASRSSLANYIELNMPKGQPEKCIGDCAALTANHIYDSLIMEVEVVEATLNTLPAHKSPLRRLTYNEYDKTLNSLLGVTSKSEALPAETTFEGFAEDASAQSSNASLMRAFYQAAVDSVNEAGDLSSKPACPSDTCIQNWINSVGARAYRRPLIRLEREAYWALFTDVRNRSGHQEAFKSVATAMLISPNFLYLAEMGQGFPNRGNLTFSEKGTATVPLTDFELAARLSYLILDENPDQQLIELAQQRILTTPAVLSEQFDRLMSIAQSSNNGSGIETRLVAWLDLKTPGEMAEEFSLSAKESERIYAQAVTFLKNWFFGDKPFSQLYTGNIQVDLNESAFNLDPNMNFGALGLRAFILSHSRPGTPTPITRGVFAVEHLLCDELGAPPANVVIEVPPRGDKTEREWLEQHSNLPGCNTCHLKIDSYGIIFDEFDAVGRYRTEEKPGVPIDPSSDLAEIGDVAGLHTNLISFAQTMSASDRAQKCHSETWYRTAMARDLGGQYDEAYFDLLVEEWKKQGGSAKSFLKTIVTSPLFTHRIVD